MPKRHSSHTTAIFLVVLSAILYGFLGLLGTKILEENISISSMLFWRFAIASLWMIGYMLFTQKSLSVSRSHKKIFLFTLTLGALFYSGSSAFYFIASKYTGTGLAMVIFFSYPVFVAAFSWFSHKSHVTKHAIYSLIIIIFGLFLLKGQGKAALSAVGIFFAVLAALSYACYVMGSKKSTDVISSSLLTTLICLGNTVIFFIYAYSTHSFAVPTHWNTWFYLIALGVIVTAVPIQLLLAGLKHVSPLKVSVISALEPIVTLLLGMIFLHEAVSTLQLIGVLIILAGAVLIQFERQPRIPPSF